MIESDDYAALVSLNDKEELRRRMRRFWKKVGKKGTDECWPWLANKDKDGYGMFWLNGRNHGAHRVSFEFHHRILKPGELACHTCDNPSCVNPSHLFAGTHLENHRDRDAKGRKAPTTGEMNGQSRFTEADVIAIRVKRAAGARYCDLRREYGCGEFAIRGICTRKRWNHIP